MVATLGELFATLFARSLLCLKSEQERKTWQDVGRDKFVTLINTMDPTKPINMVLPAFPFKSPNCSSHGKVLGVLPDAGEEMALMKLEGFCRRVEEFHSPGAHVVIFSDGRVFNDLLGVDNQRVTEYNRKCKEIAKRNNLTHLSFTDLDSHVDPSDIEASNDLLIEKIAKKYVSQSFDLEAAITGELASTYIGFRSFLVLDLARKWQQPVNGKPMSKKEVERECKKIAKKMIVRNQAFSALVSAKFPNHLRLSIHSGNLQGPKWSVSLLNTKPNSNCCASATPWHNVLCETSNGEVFAVKHMEVDLNKYELITLGDQPWCFKERGSTSPRAAEDESKWCRIYPLPDEACLGCTDSTESEQTDNINNTSDKNIIRENNTNNEDTNNGNNDNSSQNTNTTPNNSNNNDNGNFVPPTTVSEHILNTWKHLPVTFDFLKPFGVVIKVNDNTSNPPSLLHDVPATSIRELVCLFSTVLLRGFAHLSREEYIKGAERVGSLVMNPHGVITDVREENDPKISVFTKESMPLHYDGMFKMKMDTTKNPPVQVSDVAFMQIFQCVEPPAPMDDGGITTFVDTRRILNTFSSAEVEAWKNLNIGYYMPPSGLFGGQWVYTNAVCQHPISGHNILRIHEPWPIEKSAKFAIAAKAANAEEQPVVDKFFETVMPYCFDDRFMLKQSWERDDVLFADNHAQLHARTAYTTSNRHLRRIHIQD